MKQALARLESRRGELEHRLDGVRRALDREVGWAPSNKAWIVPLLAFGCGLALGLRRSSSRRDELD